MSEARTSCPALVAEQWMTMESMSCGLMALLDKRPDEPADELIQPFGFVARHIQVNILGLAPLIPDEVAEIVNGPFLLEGVIVPLEDGLRSVDGLDLIERLLEIRFRDGVTVVDGKAVAVVGELVLYHNFMNFKIGLRNIQRSEARSASNSGKNDRRRTFSQKVNSRSTST